MVGRSARPAPASARSSLAVERAPRRPRGRRPRVERRPLGVEALEDVARRLVAGQERAVGLAARCGWPGTPAPASSHTTVTSSAAERARLAGAGRRRRRWRSPAARVRPSSSASTSASRSRKASSPSSAKISAIDAAGALLERLVGVDERPVEARPPGAGRPWSCPSPSGPRARPGPAWRAQPSVATKASRLRRSSSTRVAAELAGGLVGEHERHHRLGHHAEGGHGGDVGALLERHRLLLGGRVDGLERRAG